MPVLYIFPASQVVAKKPITSMAAEVQICHMGTPNGIRIIMMTGEVKGINDIHKANGPSGWLVMTPTIMTEKISGIETGSMNCCVSAS